MLTIKSITGWLMATMMQLECLLMRYIKQQKIAFLESIRNTRNNEPTSEEIDAFHRTSMLDAYYKRVQGGSRASWLGKPTLEQIMYFSLMATLPGLHNCD